MEEIRSLSDVSFNDLYAAHEEAFKDYERKWTKDEYARMLHRRGYTSVLSFGAFDGQRLVSFTLNGIGAFNGLRTAYDTGTGTVLEYRGRGLTGRIFEASLPQLRHAGVQQYLLEVLQHNTVAVNIYLKAGLSAVRELGYFVTPKEEIVLRTKALSANVSLKEVSLSESLMSSMWDFHPSWQNSFEALKRTPEHFIIMGAFDGSKLVGYGIVETATGDVPQLAVDEASRRQGIGTALLAELIKRNNAGVVRVINTDAGYQPMTDFLAANKIQQSGKQFEMIRMLE